MTNITLYLFVPFSYPLVPSPRNPCRMQSATLWLRLGHSSISCNWRLFYHEGMHHGTGKVFKHCRDALLHVLHEAQWGEFIFGLSFFLDGEHIYCLSDHYSLSCSTWNRHECCGWGCCLYSWQSPSHPLLLFLPTHICWSFPLWANARVWSNDLGSLDCWDRTWGIISCTPSMQVGCVLQCPLCRGVLGLHYWWRICDAWYGEDGCFINHPLLLHPHPLFLLLSFLFYYYSRWLHNLLDSALEELDEGSPCGCIICPGCLFGQLFRECAKMLVGGQVW
jgi:hypothetical protein